MVQIEILDVAQDPKNGSIIVRTNYKIDGVEVQSNYPPLGGKYYWQTRYNTKKLEGMSDAEIEKYIFDDISAFGNNLIRKKYLTVNDFVSFNGSYIPKQDRDDYNAQFIQNKLNVFIGKTKQVKTAEIIVDANGDGVQDTKWVVSSDGTRTEEPYTPPVVVTP